MGNSKCDPYGRKGKGFTLIEILVVVAIIGILATLIVPGLFKSLLKAKIGTTRTEIHNIKAALESYYTAFGDYPPSSLGQFGISVNQTNNGIESLVACLSTQQKSGPFLRDWPEDRLTNLDDDSVQKNLTNWWFGDNQLREIVDLWGNSFIYFHARDYENPGRYAQYNIGDEIVECIPRKSEKTKAYYRPQDYQIWSVGPDGKDSTEDDIPGW